MRFRRYSNRSYAVFSTLKSPVSIGVMTVAMLASAPVSGISAQTAEKTMQARNCMSWRKWR